MASTSMMIASPVAAGFAERTLGRRTLEARPSSFLGQSVSLPRAALPVRSYRAQSIRADVRNPADAAKEFAKDTGSEAKRLAKEGPGEAKNRTGEAAQDFKESVQETGDQWKKAGSDIAGKLKKEADDVAKPADDLLAKTRQEGREALDEAGDKFKNPGEYNLGEEIKGSAGKAAGARKDEAQDAASRAGNAVSESAQSQGKEFVKDVTQGFSEAGDRLKGAVKDAVQDTKDFVNPDGAKERVKEGQKLVRDNVESARDHANEAVSKD